ncbi:MAG: hypothetical protein ACJ72H_18245 [Candidatus Sulfotelmatobacter sp.]
MAEQCAQVVPDFRFGTVCESARFTIPPPALLAKVVDLVDHVPMDDRDTKGDGLREDRSAS